MMLVAVALLLAVASPPCPPGTAVVFSCAAKKKHIAVCIDASRKPSFAQYRFGPADVIATAPELVFPKNTAEGFRPFVLTHHDLPSGTSTTLSFKSGDYGYEVYSQDGRDAGAGVNVMKHGKLTSSIACTGTAELHWDRLATHVVEESDVVKFDDSGASAGAQGSHGAHGARAATSGGPRPDPTAGKSMKEVCNDDVLLLTRYSWSALTAGSAQAGSFHKHCCVNGALGADDDRCQLDWPSSDVPACGYYDELRNGLFARYGYVFKEAKWQKHFGATDWYAPRADFDTAWLPKVVQANVATLKPLGCPRP